MIMYVRAYFTLDQISRVEPTRDRQTISPVVGV